MLKSRFQVSRGRWLTALSALLLFAACGSTKTNSSETGGSAAESGWTFLPPGSMTPGSATGGAGPNAGSSSGGAPGRAGSAGAGGAVLLPPVTFKCGGKQPNQPVITSFDDFMADRWLSPGNLDGGVYVYPDTLKPTAGDFLRFADLVKDYTGMGVWFNGCIDASKFRGVRFTISGDAGMTGKVQFYAISQRDKEVVEKDGVGACVPADPSASWDSCRPPAVSLAVTAQPTVRSVPWSAFTGGRPSDKTDGSDVIALQWSFNWDFGDIPYAGELTVDDVAFFNDENEGGAGGAPGAGGSPADHEAGSATTPGAGGQAGSN